MQRIQSSQTSRSATGQAVSALTVRLIETNLRDLFSTDVTLATDLQMLAQAVVSAEMLTRWEKQAACALLAELLENLTRRQKKRRNEAAIDDLAQGFTRAIATVPELLTLWEAVQSRVRSGA
jgi:hypothetical protein